MRLGVGLACLAGMGIAVVHLAQRSVDEVRFGAGNAMDAAYMPDSKAIRVAAMGYHTMLADIMWARTVLRFADTYENPGAHQVRWLWAMLDTVATLDPTWRTIYFYGGGMLRVVGAVEESNAIYQRGMGALPEDPYFPFSLAMNAYLYNGDNVAAQRYLDRAASLPKAPPWYRGAAAGFLARGGQRKVALKYLRDQLEVETDERVRRVLEMKFESLLHDELAEQLEARWEAQVAEGRTVKELADLGPLPVSPDGTPWLISPDGRVRTKRRDGMAARRAKDIGRSYLLK